jgi:rhodanese-related sulfurtransferase
MQRIAVFSLLAALAIPFGACSPGQRDATISQNELSSAIADGNKLLLLDVRTPEEFQGGHIPGALNVPHDELGAWLGTQSLSPDTEIVVYCESGARSATAQQLFVKAGFTSVRHLEGDMKEWRECEECEKE